MEDYLNKDQKVMFLLVFLAGLFLLLFEIYLFLGENYFYDFYFFGFFQTDFDPTIFIFSLMLLLISAGIRYKRHITIYSALIFGGVGILFTAWVPFFNIRLKSLIFSILIIFIALWYKKRFIKKI